MADGKGLSQEEIDALLAGLSSEPAAEPAPGVAPVKPFTPLSPTGAAIRLYDFRHPDKLSKDQLRTLEIVHQNLARSFAFSLTASTRTVVQCSLVLLEQKRFKEYIDERPEPVVLHLVSLDPLPGRAIIEIDFELAYLIIDRLLGGPGRPIAAGRAVTEIEVSLMRTVVSSLLYSIREIWSGIIEVRPRLDDTTMNPSLVQIALPTDVVVVIVFEVRLLGMNGTISMCIPHNVIEPIIPQLSAEIWLSQKKPGNEEQAAILAQHLSAVRLPVCAILGEARITIRDILALDVGDVIPLETLADKPILIKVGARSKFTGTPGLLGKRLAIRLHEVLDEENDETLL
ncbi:MAG: flagellar motor switch protein FliM [Chloroflexi bacterium]|nr:flagellar motor switch protein FliM [Chloroflexota bacterium]GIW10409.1 MAG: flagellar motor switch protein FliM [Dehalococcoidia bacterium]